MEGSLLAGDAQTLAAPLLNLPILVGLDGVVGVGGPSLARAIVLAHMSLAGSKSLLIPAASSSASTYSGSELSGSSDMRIGAGNGGALAGEVVGALLRSIWRASSAKILALRSGSRGTLPGGRSASERRPCRGGRCGGGADARGRERFPFFPFGRGGGRTGIVKEAVTVKPS